MRSHHLFALFCGLALSAMSLLARPQSENSDVELKAGVRSYKEGHIAEARQHFERAVASDPANEQARLYLGTAYAQAFVPGLNSAENNLLGQRAIEQYKKVLEINQANADAAKSIGYLLQQMKDFNGAEDYYRKAIEIDPKDPENYYSVAVLDWIRLYEPRMAVRAKLKLKPEQSLVRFAECWAVRDANQERIQAGIEMLKKAIELRRDYDDAMAYMNLMYREKADIECGNPIAYAADLKLADQWVDVTIATKKKNQVPLPSAPPDTD